MNIQEAKNALTRLTHLCQSHIDNIKHLEESLSKNINTLALSALEVSGETENPIGEVVSKYLGEYGHLINNNDILVELSYLLESLVDTDSITQNILEKITTAPDAHWQTVSDFSAFYAQILLDKGDKESALSYAQQAACLYLRNDTSASINGINAYSIYADALLSMEELQTTELVQAEIITLYQSTGMHLAPEHCFDYADYLSNLKLSLTHLGQMEKAMDLAKQAYQLVQKKPALNTEDLHTQLTTEEVLSVYCEKTEQLNLAVKLLRECLDTARNSYNLHKENYIVRLIGVLKLSAEAETRLGNQQQALSYAKESLSYAKKGYQQHPDIFYIQYTDSLAIVANVHIKFNQFDHAIGYLTETIDSIEANAATNIEALGAGLNNRITLYLKMQQYTHALKDAYRLLLLYRHHPEFKANLALTFKTIAACYLESGDLLRALRSIQNSITRFQTLLEQDKHYLIDLIFALDSLSTLQQKAGEYPLSLKTTKEAIRLLEQGNCALKQANLSLYYSVSLTHLYSLIALAKQKEALVLSTTLIEFARDTVFESGKQFAKLLTTHAELLQQHHKE